MDASDFNTKDKKDLHLMTLEEVRKELHVTRVRMVLVQAFAGLLQFAYNALLNHGVNYQSLPEHKDTALLERAENEEISMGQVSILEWMRRMQHGITAAVRRKGIKKV